MSLSLTDLKGVGPKLAEKLSALGLQNIQQLLFHLPLRYEDRSRVCPIGSIRAGERLAIVGEVEAADIRYGRRRSLLVQVADASGSLLLRFFYFNQAQQKAFRRGMRVHCFGEVRNGPAKAEMIHPEYRLYASDAPVQLEEVITPVYPGTEGVSQQLWRKLTDQALQMMRSGLLPVPELLPDSITQSHAGLSMQQTLQYLHRPPLDADLQQLAEGRHPAQRRLAFEELLTHQASLRQLRHWAQQVSAFACPQGGRQVKKLLQSLPFHLTAAQQRVSAEISHDLGRASPMLRLIQGDVGSGKTIVAALAALQVLEAGLQVALMAPTEMLAEQHQREFEARLQPLGIEIVYLTSRAKGREREKLLQRMAAPQALIAIGTHALFQKDVVFARLGLAIIDEQHRFGVHQRLALSQRDDSEHSPHQLVMTATPIPRTLAMAAYADLDLSIIDELPPARKAVKTSVIAEQRRPDVISRVRAACAEGRQAYWVCTLIQESESLQCQAAQDTAELLSEALPELNVGLLHGRMKAAEKSAVMQQFHQADIDLLVATTVIEVGVDVSNASLMIIENAERLGLAQLHQLRGRVGRGSQQSFCVLMYGGRLSANGKARLKAMRESNDGFQIARLDLEIRGPGEILGTRQTGLLQMRVADLIRDAELLPPAQQAADQLLQEHAELLPSLIERWMGKRLDYARA